MFRADTVYGLACDPPPTRPCGGCTRSRDGGPDKPAAVMFFDRALALDALPELPGAHARHSSACSPVR